MRPARLEIEGFTSFRDHVEIDFSELELFVITGPTGSGKTSILDAVTLALYGNVPRTKKKELKDLISLGASQAKVQLEFEADGEVYRIARRVPRNGAQSATVERLDGDSAVTEIDKGGVLAVNERIVEIVGLDYDAFTRAVLLPQGAFSEFLNGDAAQRREILIRLLDLGRFVRVGKRANEEASRLSMEVAAGETVLAAEYEEVTKEALKQARSYANRFKKQAKSLSDALKKARTKLATGGELRRKLAALEDVAKKLKAQNKAIAAVTKTWDGLAERDAATKKEVESLLEAKKVAEAACAEARSAMQELTEEIGDAAALERLASAVYRLSEVGQKIDDVRADLESREEEHTKYSAHHKSLVKTRESAQVKEAEAETALEVARTARNGVEAKHKEAVERMDLLGKLESARAHGASIEKALTKAKAAETAAETRLLKCRQEQAAVEDENRAAAIRDHLHVGDDCPVCGAAIVDVPAVEPGLSARLEAAVSAVKEADAAFRVAGNESARLDEALAHARNAVETISEELRRFEDTSSLEEVEEALGKAQKEESRAEKHLVEAREEAKRLVGEEGTLKEKLAALKEKVEGGKLRLVELESEAKETRDVLIAALGDPLPNNYSEMISDRQGRLQALASKLAQAETGAAAARASHDRAVEVRQALDDQLKSLDEGIQSHRSQLKERCVDLGKLIAVKLTTLPDREENRSKELTIISEHCQDLEARVGEAVEQRGADVTRCGNELLELLTKHLSEYKDDDLESGVEALEHEVGTAKLNAETAKRDAEQLEEKLARKEEMKKQLAEKRERKLLYEKVAKELRTDNFVRFLLNESFHDLALRASDELERLSAGRYSLAAADDSFEVVDHANADERRSVVTLSGGETFLASLALALALAQGITDIAGHSAAARLESMFIDEGFGSLDPTALDLAVDALERLREGERMVGVITHVPAVAERIPSGIEVNREDGRTIVQMR